MWFNGKPPSEFQHTNSVTYVAQIDNHEPNLTVQETLDFAYLCLVRDKCGVQSLCAAVHVYSVAMCLRIVCLVRDKCLGQRSGHVQALCPCRGSYGLCVHHCAACAASVRTSVSFKH